MKSDLNLPAFENENEEVQWLEQNQQLINAEISRALDHGDLKSAKLTPPSQRDNERTVIRLRTGDADRARALAKKLGVRYEVFLEQLLHRELQKPEDQQESSAA